MRPVLRALFPMIGDAGISSPLVPNSALARAAGLAPEALLIKCDSLLPIAGSIKARGAFYEVLTLAEELLAAQTQTGDGRFVEAMTGTEARARLGEYRIIVGSTGNLGFGVGMIARALGFACEVHMSADAKSWKKDRLRTAEVRVVEHAGDYGSAVLAARDAAESNGRTYFIDDERSRRLMLGYATAGFELASQLKVEGPVEVYLPCGVGGAPAGIALGLAHALGERVRAIFVEPVAAPCMIARLALGVRSIYDLGLDNLTEADGLAVAEASDLAESVARALVAGAVTVTDQAMIDRVATAHDTGLRLEPAAAAGLAALEVWRRDERATQIVWTTGGGLLPDPVHQRVLGLASANIGSN